MLLTAPVDVDVPVPRLRRSAPDAVPAAGVGGTAGSRSPGPVRTSSPGGSSSRRRLGYATTTSAVEASGHLPLAGETLLPVGSTTGHLRRAGASGGRGSVASRRSRRRRAGTPAAAVRPLALVLVASLFGGLAVAASFLAPRATSVWPQVVAIVLVAVGMLLAQSTTAPRLLRLTAPVLGLVGGAVATGVLSEGPVVALVGACAGAALVALTGRSGTGPGPLRPTGLADLRRRVGRAGAARARHGLAARLRRGHRAGGGRPRGAGGPRPRPRRRRRRAAGHQPAVGHQLVAARGPSAPSTRVADRRRGGR